MRGAMEVVSAVGRLVHRRTLQNEHIAPFRWKPTAEPVQRLLAAIRTKKGIIEGSERLTHPKMLSVRSP
jgi:hypothetical protein